MKFLFDYLKYRRRRWIEDASYFFLSTNQFRLAQPIIHQIADFCSSSKSTQVRQDDILYFCLNSETNDLIKEFATKFFSVPESTFSHVEREESLQPACEVSGFSLEARKVIARAALQKEAADSAVPLAPFDLLHSLIISQGRGKFSGDLLESLLDLTYIQVHGTTWPRDDAKEAKRVVPDSEICEVILENDNYTAMGCVEKILREVFSVDESVVTGVMLDIHKNGPTSLGEFERERAIDLISKAISIARKERYPLKFSARAINGPFT